MNFSDITISSQSWLLFRIPRMEQFIDSQILLLSHWIASGEEFYDFYVRFYNFYAKLPAPNYRPFTPSWEEFYTEAVSKNKEGGPQLRPGPVTDDLLKRLMLRAARHKILTGRDALYGVRILANRDAQGASHRLLSMVVPRYRTDLQVSSGLKDDWLCPLTNIYKSFNSAYYQDKLRS